MDYRYSTYPDGVHMDPEYAEKFERVYTSTDSPLIPNSIAKEILNVAWEKYKDGTTVGEALKESERRRKIFEGGLDMPNFSYTDVWGNAQIVDNMVRKIAVIYDFHRESENEFRSRANFIANIFDADIEFRTDLKCCWGHSLIAHLIFAREFGESEEKYNNRVYLANKALNTHWDKPLPPGRCQKNSGRYPWLGWEADFDVYQGVNNKTGKLQTIVKWNDEEKTIVNCCKYELPLIYPVAYAYCIRRFGSNSAFKKKVNTTRIGDYIYGSLYSCGGKFTASVPARSKKIDIYDEMAIVIAAEKFGGILLFEDMCKGNFHKK